MSLTSRRITLQLTLGQGDFGSAGQDTVTLEGLRCSANIAYSGKDFARADVQIWGLSLDLMNKLTVTQKFWLEQRVSNRLTISAGDENGVSMCFGGTIWDAWADGRQQPDVMFYVSADSSMYDLSKPIAPTSYKGGVDASLVLSGLAQQIGYAFENSGVTGTLTNPYKPGSPKTQIESVCRDVDCMFTVDEATKTLAIWPKGKARGLEVPLISKATGLVGYPSFTQSSVQFTTLFNPNIRFGGLIKLQSQFEPANGVWSVLGVSHRLEANVPGGQWFTDVECIYFGDPP